MYAVEILGGDVEVNIESQKCMRKVAEFGEATLCRIEVLEISEQR